jgi:hypothetical protein
LNELTWLTFAVTASLDRMCKRFVAEVPKGEVPKAEAPPKKTVAFRVPQPAAARARTPVPAARVGAGAPLQWRPK